MPSVENTAGRDALLKAAVVVADRLPKRPRHSLDNRTPI